MPISTQRPDGPQKSLLVVAHHSGVALQGTPIRVAAGGNFDGFYRDRGGASRSVLLYVRTRGADETGERREINPAAPYFSLLGNRGAILSMGERSPAW